MESNVVEFVRFKLQPGSDSNMLVYRAEALNPLLEEMGGYKARYLAQHEDGEWLDVVIWGSMEQARAAADKIMLLPEGLAFGALIDPDSIVMAHYTVRSEDVKA